LEFGERRVDHGGFRDLFEGVFFLELGVGVAGGVFVGDASDFGEVFGDGAISGGEG
jgi:hypothetical protein